MKQFDLISDTHIDFWVNMDSNQPKMKNKLKEFTKRLLPDNTSDVLVIAGDLGHYNKQNLIFLNILKETYKKILLVEGNHDLYMISRNIKEKYKNNSSNRINEMKQLASQIEGVHYLDGNIIEIDEIKFSGTGMWYDFTYGTKELNIDKSDVFEAWEDYMNDGVYIKGIENRPYKKFEIEKEKLEKIIYKSDVIITHVGPDWSNITQKYKNDICTSFYYFDGNEYFQYLNEKIWCFGHTHEHYNYIKDGCRFINNALGYPNENSDIKKIINVSL